MFATLLSPYVYCTGSTDIDMCLKWVTKHGSGSAVKSYRNLWESHSAGRVVIVVNFLVVE